MSLFQLGTFTSAAGKQLSWKIECDALTTEDWECIAALVGPCLVFQEIEGVPSGGVAFADALEPYSSRNMGG